MMFFSGDISTSVYGLELKSTFYTMSEKLEKIYGKGETTDLLMPGSIWHEPNEFMTALRKKERVLMAVWEKSGDEEFKADLVRVALFASPNGRGKGYISLEYSFKNKDECDKEIASQEDDAL